MRDETCLMKPVDVAKQSCVSLRTVQRYVANGRLPVVRLPSGRYRIRPEDAKRVFPRAKVLAHAFLEDHHLLSPEVAYHRIVTSSNPETINEALAEPPANRSDGLRVYRPERLKQKLDEEVETYLDWLLND
jgi:hypothetical protein